MTEGCSVAVTPGCLTLSLVHSLFCADAKDIPHDHRPRYQGKVAYGKGFDSLFVSAIPVILPS